MLIFVYGNDAFRVQQKVHHITSAFKEKFDPSGMNSSEYPAEGKKKIELTEVMGSARALPFLGEKRLVVIRGLASDIKAAEAKTWAKALKQTPESTIVIFHEDTEVSKFQKRPLYKALKDEQEVHSYPLNQLEGVAFKKWIIQEVKQQGGLVNSDAVQELIMRVGPELWQMSHEIQKLVAYADGQAITTAMVQGLVQTNFEGKIFDLIDAISKKQAEEAVRLLEEERSAGANDHYLLTMLGRQVKILLGAKAFLETEPGGSKQVLAKKLSVHPFVAQKALAQARGFSMQTLLDVHEKLYTFDKWLKTGQISVDMAVDLTASQLTKN